MDKSLSNSEIDIVRAHLTSVLVKQSDRITLSETYQALKDKFPGSVENIFIGQLNKAIKENKFPGMTIFRGRYGGIRLDKPTVPGIKPPAITFVTPRTKPLAEVTASDIPRGLCAEDVAVDCGPSNVEEVEEPANEELYDEMKELIETSTKPYSPFERSEEGFEKVSKADMQYLQGTPVPLKTNWGAPQPPAKKDLWMKGRHYQVPHTTNEIKTLLEKVLEVKEDPEGAIKFDGKIYSCSELAMEFFDKFLFYFYGVSIAIL